MTENKTNSDGSKIFIVDGMSLLFRSFYAMGSRLTAPDGTPVGAVYGFLKVVFKILREQKPTHFAVCWDLKEKTFRHEVFENYKANRSEPPDDIIPQIPLIKKVLADMDCPMFAIPGYEADDLAGSLARYFEHYGHVYLITADKDFMQIVNDRTFLFSLKKGDEYDIIDKEKVYDYFGVFPDHVIDILGLIGDASDNIPGVKGIGEKGASKLIAEFGTVENIYENLDKINNPRLRQMLESQKETALFSKYLVTIKTDVPMNVSEFSLRFYPEKLQNNSVLKNTLDELNMKALVKSLFSTPNTLFESAEPSKIADEKKATNVLFADTNNWGKRNYTLVQSEEDIQNLLTKITSLNENSFFALDTETTGLDIIEDKPIGVSLCFEEGTAYYIPASDSLWEQLNHALQQCRATIVAHNLKFDLHMLKNVGVDISKNKIACTMVAAWLTALINDVGYSLDALTFKYFRLQKIPTSALIGKETKRTSMTEVPIAELSEYACEDADAVFRLWVVYQKKLEDDPALKKLFFDIEMPVLKILTDMERTGVHIDVDYLANLASELKTKIAQLEEEIYAITGFQFKISSPKQLGDVLFEHLKIHEVLGYKGKLARTSQGYKTDASVLEEYEDHHFVSLIRQYRELNKLLSTYVLALPELIKPSTHRLHTHFNQIGTVTGRLSSSEPNLQNVPIRTEWGKRVRAAFTAVDKNHVIISADYSQIELRVLAHLAHDENMISAFQSERDFHRQTAAQIMGKDPDAVTLAERGQAKAINFGIIYGMGARKLAKSQKITFANAQHFIQKYFVSFQKVKDFIDLQRASAHTTGIAVTLFGRKRALPNLKSTNALEVKTAENMAINSPIQGTSAEIMKLGMIAVANEIAKRNLKTKMILQVHDELVFEAPEHEAAEVVALLKHAMETVVNFDVPMRVDIGVGANWSLL